MAADVTLLGTAEVRIKGATMPLPADRRGCLLAYLAYDGGWVDRDRLALLFWPDSDESGAKRNLRQLLARTRRLPLAAALEVTGSALRWRVECDVDRFRRALASGDHAGAVAVCRGPLLARFNVYDVGAFDAWLDVERERVHAGFHEAVVQSANGAIEAGRFDQACASLKRLLDLDPLAEDVLQPYIRALALTGRREAALAAYERFAAQLDEELGLEPLEGTRDLVAQLRTTGVVTAPTATPRPRDAPAQTLRPPRLVARAAEADALRAATTPVTIVTGEPGVGKTRLLRDLLGQAAWTNATEGLSGLPYEPIASLLRREPDLAAGLGPYREDVARLVPEVAPDLLPAPVDPETSKARLVEGLARAVEAATGPLVIDDLQWADPATIELLTYLAARGTRAFASVRAGEVGSNLRRALDALRSRDLLTLVPLEPLDEAGVRALLGDLTGRPRGPELFSRWLWQRSAGNPLFALETLRVLFDAGVLRDGAYGWETDIDELTSDYAELDVPPVVAEVIRRRLGFLDESTVRVLEAATVFGGNLDPRQLAGIAGLSPQATADALSEAERAGFVVQRSFRHDLLRQSLYADIPSERRLLLHALAAEASMDGDPGVIAEHWLAAGEASRARDAWREQASRLRDRGLQVEAERTLRRALERCEAPLDRAWLLVALANTQRERSLLDEAAVTLDAVFATPHDDEAVRLAAAVARASLLLVLGRLHEADEVLRTSQTRVSLVGDDDARLDHVMLRARVAKQLLHTEDAVALLEPELPSLRRRRPSTRLCQFLTSLGALHDDLGQNAAALPLHREAYALAGRLGARYLQIDIAINLVFCLADLGRYDEAVRLGEQALQLGDYDNVAILRNNLASVAFSQGRFDSALAHYQSLQHEHGQPFLRVIALARSAESLAQLDRNEEVAALLDEALAGLATTDYPVALARVTAAVLHLGDDDQVARLRERVPRLDPERIPAHQRETVVRLWRERIGVTPT